jgi:hypothetical protein
MIQVNKLDRDRYYVKINQGGEYLVDIAEFGNSGWCGCPDFTYTHLPNQLKLQEEGYTEFPISRCKHLRMIVYYLGKGKSNDANPTPLKEEEEDL